MSSASRPVAVVTGGTRGIGRGISEALAELGFDVLLGYGSNSDAATQWAEELQSKYGVKAAISGGDVAETATIDGYFQTLDDKFAGQQLKAVVHNAGQYLGRTAANCEGIEDSEPRRFGSLLQSDGTVDFSHMRYYHRIYAEAWVQLVERAVPRFCEGGAVVGISSPGVNCMQPPAFQYDMPGSAKTVMETSARHYAKNLASRGIRVNVVIPGITESDAWKALAKSSGKGADDHSMANALAQVRSPIGRASTAKEVGDVVAFLCSDKASVITGVALPVDGGLHLGAPMGSGKGKSDGSGEGKGK